MNTPVQQLETLRIDFVSDIVCPLRSSGYRINGNSAVPAVIISQRHQIAGGQPVEVFERALRRIAQSGDAR